MNSKCRNAQHQNNAGSFAPRLAAYSATAAAALAFAPHAHAQIINITSFSYAGLTNTTTPPSLTLSLQVNNRRVSFSAGPFDLKIGGRHGLLFAHTKTSYGTAYIKGTTMAFANSSNGTRGVAYKLSLGAPLKQQPGFVNFAQLARRRSDRTTDDPFQPGANGAVTGYVGFKAVQSGHAYYGWFNVKVTGDAKSLADTVSLVAKNGEPGVFGAYEISTAPGINSFKAGDAIPLPEPAEAAVGLGLLAFGAAGVREMRRRRKQAACSG